jgi:uncharacterized protein YndB with AHSA1/START domain
MSSHLRQAHLAAPLEEVWSLIASPSRFPEWWPRVVEVAGDRFEEGDSYVQVTRTPAGKLKSHFLIERREDLREIRMSCQRTGTYADWLITPAQGGTFIELEMGMHPRRLDQRLMDAAIGKRYFQTWSQKSLEALEAALPGDAAPGT